MLNDDARLRTTLMSTYDAIILSPGPGRPSAAQDLGWSTRAFYTGRPVLGVCLGFQALCHEFGGQVAEATPMHGRTSTIRCSPDPLFAGIPEEFIAVRYHSLACQRLPDVLQPLASADDGTLMAARHRARPLWGVQFHPESACSEYGARLALNFARIAVQAGLPLRPAARARTVVRQSPSPSREWRAGLHHRKAKVDVSAADAFRVLYGDSEHAFWLDSATECPGSISIMGDASGPLAERVSYSARRRRVDVESAYGSESHDRDIFDYLRDELRRRRCGKLLPFGFSLGYVGYLGYETKSDCGGEARYDSELPDAYFIFADRALVFEHGTTNAYLLCVSADGTEARAWMDEVEARLRLCKSAKQGEPGRADGGLEGPELRHTKAEYLAMIDECKRQIRRGESYEICLTNQIQVTGSVDPLPTYLRLREVNPAPFAAFLRATQFSILSSSPEQFLRVNSSGMVYSKPIKGTASRSEDPTEDRRLAEALRISEKDRAENLMIVDLVRNDLGRACQTGTVKVDGLFEIETYETVHQLVSTIRGKLRAGLHPIECVRACFPGGSMTGAPKIRTMEIIDRLEGGPRGPYSGALGYLSLDDEVNLSIVIRTMVVTPEATRIGIGGAIVDLSDPELEFVEAELKGRALLRALSLSST